MRKASRASAATRRRTAPRLNVLVMKPRISVPPRAGRVPACDEVFGWKLNQHLRFRKRLPTISIRLPDRSRRAAGFPPRNQVSMFVVDSAPSSGAVLDQPETRAVGIKDHLTPATYRGAVVAAAVLVAGLAATFTARTVTERMMAADMRQRFATDAAATTDAIGQRLRAHGEVLVSMQGLYASVGRVDRAQFRRYVDVLDLERRYPGFQALQALRHVQPADLDSFIAEVRSDTSLDPRGQPGFHVHPEGQRRTYSVVELVEPLQGNENSVGFDAGAN